MNPKKVRLFFYFIFNVLILVKQMFICIASKNKQFMVRFAHRNIRSYERMHQIKMVILTGERSEPI